jgi:acylphosphatase
MDVYAKITVKGIVQGVGYRWFADRAARRNGLKGFVENLPNGDVYLEVEGERGLVNDLIGQLKVGPRGASVDDVAVEWNKPKYLFLGFKIKA